MGDVGWGGVADSFGDSSGVAGPTVVVDGSTAAVGLSAGAGSFGVAG